MSRTFTLKGHGSFLEADLYPPVELNPNYDYCLGLIGLFTYNSIPNVETGVNDKLYYYHSSSSSNSKEKEDVDLKKLIIPTGSYEISDLERYIQEHINGSTKTSRDQIFSLKPNNNTLKAELQSIYNIDFGKEGTLGNLLGFSKKVLVANTKHESDMPVNIIKVTSIRVECNIVTGSFYAGLPCHTLYEFSPTVDPGYAINIEPMHPLYLPLINKNVIDKITIKLIDQNSDPVNFRGEEVVVRLELKTINGSYISQ